MPNNMFWNGSGETKTFDPSNGKLPNLFGPQVQVKPGETLWAYTPSKTNWTKDSSGVFETVQGPPAQSRQDYQDGIWKQFLDCLVKDYPIIRNAPTNPAPLPPTATPPFPTPNPEPRVLTDLRQRLAAIQGIEINGLPAKLWRMEDSEVRQRSDLTIEISGTLTFSQSVAYNGENIAVALIGEGSRLTFHAYPIRWQQDFLPQANRFKIRFESVGSLSLIPNPPPTNPAPLPPPTPTPTPLEEKPGMLFVWDEAEVGIPETALCPRLQRLLEALEDIGDPDINKGGPGWGLEFDGPYLFYAGDEYGTTGPALVGGSFETSGKFWVVGDQLTVTTQNDGGTKTQFQAVVTEVRELPQPPGASRRYEVEYESRGAIAIANPDGSQDVIE